jgi:uncharacterized protein YndB with AHSA1/START domain
MSDVKKNTQARRFEMAIDIDAPADAVWSALTEAEELTRWFPLEARVVPGEGGSMYWGWGGDWGGESKIAAWEPNRRLKLIESRQGFDADGKPLERPGGNRDLVVEVTLESHAGTTRVRLVHSGFGSGADWDDELDGVSNGWQIELRCLKDYVERYRGRDRLFAWARASSELPQEEAWARLKGPDGVHLQVLPPDGRSYTLDVASQRFAGLTALSIPNDFVGRVDGSSATIRVGTFRGGGRTGLMLVFTSYDAADTPLLRVIETDGQALLDRVSAAAVHQR